MIDETMIHEAMIDETIIDAQQLILKAFLKLFGVLLLCHSSLMNASVFAQTDNSSASADWYLDAINMPETLPPTVPPTVPPAVQSAKNKKPIVIAIVDDGFRTSHAAIKNYLWTNPKETPLNNIDDDGNGLIDDVQGWDVADGNNRVEPPAERLEEYYHGTHLAGLVTRVLQSSHAQSNKARFKILPIKALPDQANHTYIKQGYAGIEYALAAGADIILTAWGVEHITSAESAILQKAQEQEVLIIASAGNQASGKPQYPAAADQVLAVAALGLDGHKMHASNFGMFVDLLAPGEQITSSSVSADDAYEIREGTSQAAALVTAAAALLKQQQPDYSAQQIMACLKQTADPVKATHKRLHAGLGAGTLNIAQALACDLFTDDGSDLTLGVTSGVTSDVTSGDTSGDASQKSNSFSKPQAYLFHQKRFEKEHTWRIQPQGEFKGLRFYPKSMSGAVKGSVLEFYAGAGAQRKFVESFPLEALPKNIYVPSTAAEVVLKPNSFFRELSLLMEYRSEPIDYSSQYCKDTVSLNKPGVLTDGSADQPYMFYSNCKWQITAPPGQQIVFNFSELDTQKNIDKIYFFNGRGTHEDVMAIISGQKPPPEFKTWSNEVLVWFVSDGEKEGQGWQAEFNFVE